jgi:ABC-type oligopeptide transport system substrate-binding subunit
MQPNTSSGSSKNLLFVGLVILALVVAAYFYFTADRTADTDLLDSVSVAPVDGDLLTTLEQLKAISLDEGVFANQVFLSLTDFSRDLVAQPTGRANPFAPFTPEEWRIGNLATSSLAVPSFSSTSR